LPQNGDPYGTRAALAGRGITGGVNYIGEVLGNAQGGVKRGTTYDGRLELYADIDFEKLAGWNGLSFHANAYQIHGKGLTTYNVQNLFATSYIEATEATRLFEVWFEQKVLSDKLLVRFGQLAADSEFGTSDTAGQFINGTFGWLTSFAANLPSGGAAYPLATPGVRVKFEPTGSATYLLGFYNGDPTGPRCRDKSGNAGNPQDCNDHGLDFRLGDNVFAIAEAQFKYNQDKSASGLPGVIKLGGWTHFGTFNDNRFDVAGVTIATSGNAPRRIHGNHALYAMIDQHVYADASERAINIFARISGLPGDRNTIDAYGDVGVKFSGFVPGRKADTFGAGFAYGRVADGQRAASRDNIAAGTGVLAADFEAVLELSYIAHIVPGWTVQPDFQYVWHPGARLADDGQGKPIGDAAIFGVRTSINY
jgi:porin